jgi:hypothetical protein
VSNNQILQRSYKNIVLRDFKEILLMHQTLGHYLCRFGLILLKFGALNFFYEVLVYFKDILNKYFINRRWQIKISYVLTENFCKMNYSLCDKINNTIDKTMCMCNVYRYLSMLVHFLRYILSHDVYKIFH